MKTHDAPRPKHDLVVPSLGRAQKWYIMYHQHGPVIIPMSSRADPIRRTKLYRKNQILNLFGRIYDYDKTRKDSWLKFGSASNDGCRVNEGEKNKRRRSLRSNWAMDDGGGPTRMHINWPWKCPCPVFVRSKLLLWVTRFWLHWHELLTWSRKKTPHGPSVAGAGFSVFQINTARVHGLEWSACGSYNKTISFATIMSSYSAGGKSEYSHDGVKVRNSSELLFEEPKTNPTRFSINSPRDCPQDSPAMAVDTCRNIELRPCSSFDICCSTDRYMSASISIIYKASFLFRKKL